MKFKNEDLMKAMGLKIGDIIVVNNTQYTIKEYKGTFWYSALNEYYPLVLLIDKDFEILPKPRRVGDALCKDTECDKCPLRTIHCSDITGDMMGEISLYGILDYQNKCFPDQEIYDLLKSRLDKEVE